MSAEQEKLVKQLQGAQEPAVRKAIVTRLTHLDNVEKNSKSDLGLFGTAYNNTVNFVRDNMQWLEKNNNSQFAGRGGVRSQEEQETTHSEHNRSFGDYVNLLSLPQRTLKESISGDENIWGDKPEGMSNEVYAGLSVAGDLVLDPLNAVGTGLLATGSKMIPKGAMDGSILSNARNYIKNHYGNTDTGSAFGESVHKAIADYTPDQVFSQLGKPANQAEKIAMSKKAQGMAGVVGNAVYDVGASIVSPTARARYADTGVSGGSQRAVREHLAAGGQRDITKAHAQAVYNNHQIEQAGRVGPKAPVLEELSKQANLVGYTPVQENTVADLLQQTAGTKVVAGKTVSEPSVLSDADAKFIQEHIQGPKGVWKTNFDDMVVKHAQSGPGGNNFQDVIKKSPLAPVVSKVFQQFGGKPTMRQLYDGLKEINLAPKQTKGGFKIKNPSYEDAVEHGLWLEGSIVGNAVTEGGVNWLAKVDTDGTLSFVISDKHDFADKFYGKFAKTLNKVPGVNLSEDITKRSLLAVSPVMQISIQNLRKNQWAKPSMADAPPSPALYSSRPTPGAPKGKTQTGLLEEYTNVIPTEQTLRAAQMQNAGAGLLSARAYEDIEND